MELICPGKKIISKGGVFIRMFVTFEGETLNTEFMLGSESRMLFFDSNLVIAIAKPLLILTHSDISSSIRMMKSVVMELLL